jgi:hypothetical protein
LSVTQEPRNTRLAGADAAESSTPVERAGPRRHLLPRSDGARYRQLTLVLGAGGGLTLTSHEMGAGLEAAWGADDNETTLTLRSEAVARLAFALLCEQLEGRPDGLERLASYCEQYGIETERACWT